MPRTKPPTPPPAEPKMAARRPRSIPAAHHALVLKLRGEINPATGLTWSISDVTQKLFDDHGVKCSRSSVQRLEAALAKNGEALLIKALRDDFRDGIAPMKAKLQRAVKKLDTMVASEPRTDRVASGVRALTGVVDSYSKLSGVAAPIAMDVKSDGQPLSATHDALLAALTRAASAHAGGAAGAGGAEPPEGGG